MRFLLSTVAATALLATPALSQTLDNDLDEPRAAEPGAAQPMGAGVDIGQLQQDLSAAGFMDATELTGAEVFHSTYQGQQALVIILDEEIQGVAAADQPDAPDTTAAIPDDEWDDELAESPAEPGLDDELAGTPDDPALDEDFADAPEFEEPAATGTVPGEGIEDDLTQSGFDMPHAAQDGQVFQTTTADGRTMLIVLAQDFGPGPGVGPAEPGAAPGTPAEPGAAPESPELQNGELDEDFQ